MTDYERAAISMAHPKYVAVHIGNATLDRPEHWSVWRWAAEIASVLVLGLVAVGFLVACG
jgi:hypothetical protein